MKKKKKLLSIVMIAVFVLTIVPTTNIEAKEKSKITYTLKDGVLTLNGKGKMPDSMGFTSEKIKKVVIEKGITSICEEAFSELINLESVEIADTVTKIGNGAFLDCPNLTSVRIPNSVTKIEDFCFRRTGIKEITIPKSVKEMGKGLFIGCENLTEVTMPGNFQFLGDSYEEYDVYTEDENRLFDYDNNIEKVTFNTDLNLDNTNIITGKYWEVYAKDKKYKSVDGAIYSKDGKDLVKVPPEMSKLNVPEGCTTLCINAFSYYMDSWYSINMSPLSINLPKSVTKIDVKKYGMEKNTREKTIRVKEIVLEDIWQFDIANVIKLGNELIQYNRAGRIRPLCSSLGERVKEKNELKILDETVVLECINPKEKMIIPEGVKIILPRVFDEENKEENIIKEVILPKGIEEIGDYAFHWNIKLKKINFPSTLKKIGSYAFAGTGIKEIDMPSSIKKWGKGIFACSSIKQATLPNNMKNIPEEMFYWCHDLKKVNVPKKIKTVGNGAFSETNINVNIFLKNKNLTTIGEEAFYQTNWKKITIPKNVKKIGARGITPKKVEKTKITILGNTKGYKANAFVNQADYRNHTILKFKGKASGLFTCISKLTSDYNADSKKTTVHLKWFKVDEVDGYQIITSFNKNYTKNVKTVNVGSKVKQKKIKMSGITYKLYAKVRPYKIIKGKKVYGKWAKAKY